MVTILFAEPGSNTCWMFGSIGVLALMVVGSWELNAPLAAMASTCPVRASSTVTWPSRARDWATAWSR